MHYLLSLDVMTMITVSMALYALCFVATLLILKWNPDIPGARLFAWGNLTGSAGYFFLLLRAFGFYVPPILIGNALIATSYYLYFCGLGANAGRPCRRHSLFLSALCIYMVYLFHFATVHASLPLRVAGISFFLAALSVASVINLGPRLRAGSPVHWLMALIFTLHGVSLLSWTVRNLLNLSDTRTMLEGGSYMTPMYFQGILFIYSLSVAYMAIISIGLQSRLRQQARSDHLTGLFNRKAFDELSRQIFARARVSQKPVAVLMLDLDHFKRVNDTYGHAVGDAVLSRFARTASGVLRPTDLMARFGGEEFVVLLSNPDMKTTLDIAERLRAMTEALSFPSTDNELTLTVSIGAAMGFPAAGDDFEKLFHQADAALYRAKALGRNRVEVARKGVSEAALPEVSDGDRGDALPQEMFESGTGR